MDANRNRNKIAVVMPSRGRPTYANEVWNNILSTAKDDRRLKFYIYIDTTDPEREGYEQKFAGLQPSINLFLNGREGLEYDSVCYKITEMAKAASNEGADFILSIGDDNHFVQDGWDDRLDEIYACYPDRLLCAGWNSQERDDVCTAFCMSKELLSVLGWFFPPEYIHFHGDIVLREVMSAIGRFSTFPDIFVDDMNPKYGFKRTGRIIDETHSRHRTPDIIKHDQDLYLRSGPMAIAATNRVREEIEKFRKG
jgi:hypothetical protein